MEGSPVAKKNGKFFRNVGLGVPCRISIFWCIRRHGSKWGHKVQGSFDLFFLLFPSASALSRASPIRGNFYMDALNYIKMSFEDPQAFLALLLGGVLATSAALHSTAADCKPAGLRACCQSHSTWKSGMSLCLFLLKESWIGIRHNVAIVCQRWKNAAADPRTIDENRSQVLNSPSG